MTESVYLNHAGTSWPKPGRVQDAMANALRLPLEDWPASFALHHQAVARWLGVGDRSRLLLTPGCTSALAVALADFPFRPGERVLCGSFEHEALARPLQRLNERGVEVVAVPTGTDACVDLERYERELESGARLVACAWANNITGELAPVESIVALAHAHGAQVLLDAAQVAGILPIDVASLNVDLLAFAGHKGPQAPWGIGGLYVAPGVPMACGDGVCTLGEPARSMPGYCDVGSVDRIALAGLAAGIEWLDARPERLSLQRHSIAQLAQAAHHPALQTLGPSDPVRRVPTLALAHAERSGPELAARLRARGLMAAGGLMCAPAAHATLGTEKRGVLRLSVGPAITEDDVNYAKSVLREDALWD
ncbi:MAG: aminotransferase class V-fold PLP-dependent enzyme [Myxococcota bacterium]